MKMQYRVLRRMYVILLVAFMSYINEEFPECETSIINSFWGEAACSNMNKVEVTVIWVMDALFLLQI